MTIGGGLAALTSYTATDFDGFIANLDSTGTPTWRTSVSGPADQKLQKISVQADGSFYVMVRPRDKRRGRLSAPY